MKRAFVALALLALVASQVAGARADEPGAPQAVHAPHPPERLPAFGEEVHVDRMPEPVHRVAPSYPDAARSAGVTGTVMVQALVGRDGLVKDTRVVRSIPMLDDAAVAAVRQWKFEPALVENEPVAVWMAVPVRFSIDGRSAPAPGDGKSGARRAVPAPDTDPLGIAPEWGAPVEPLFLNAFNVRLAAAGDSAWAKSPATIAIEFVGGADCECARFTVDVGSPPERFDEADVTLTRAGFMDDSVRGDRYRIHMRLNPGGIWNLTRATVAWRCQQGRGHEGYSPDPCR